MLFYNRIIQLQNGSITSTANVYRYIKQSEIDLSIVQFSNGLIKVPKTDKLTLSLDMPNYKSVYFCKQDFLPFLTSTVF